MNGFFVAAFERNPDVAQTAEAVCRAAPSNQLTAPTETKASAGGKRGQPNAGVKRPFATLAAAQPSDEDAIDDEDGEAEDEKNAQAEMDDADAAAASSASAGSSSTNINNDDSSTKKKRKKSKEQLKQKKQRQ